MIQMLLPGQNTVNWRNKKEKKKKKAECPLQTSLSKTRFHWANSFRIRKNFDFHAVY